MNFFKKKNGITLLALIVTIVVLLILISITLYYTLGPNGLFQKAQLTQKEVGDFYLNEETTRNDFLDEYYYENTDSIDKIVEDVPIPFGFYYVTGTKSTGVVISDNPADENQINKPASELKGNQFVWIPVMQYDKIDFENSNKSYGIPSNNTSALNEGAFIKNSIQKYGGYFIGRYETSRENNTLLVQSGKNPLVNISISTAFNDASSLYKKTDTAYGATSTIVYGTQWDQAMKYLQSDYDVLNSSSWGNLCTYVPSNITTRNLVSSSPSFLKQVIVEMGNVTITNQVSESSMIIPYYGGNKQWSLTTSLEEGSSAAYLRIRQYSFNDSYNIVKNKSSFRPSNELPSDCITDANGKFDWHVPNLDFNINRTNQPITSSMNIQIDALQYDNISIPSTGGWPVSIESNLNQQIISIHPISKVTEFTPKYRLAYFSDTQSINVNYTILPNTKKVTASNDDWKSKNIYDLAGNVYEWTMESTGDNFVARGGKYYDDGNSDYAAKRMELSPNTTNDWLGYRIALYIK